MWRPYRGWESGEEVAGRRTEESVSSSFVCFGSTVKSPPWYPARLPTRKLELVWGASSRRLVRNSASEVFRARRVSSPRRPFVEAHHVLLLSSVCLCFSVTPHTLFYLDTATNCFLTRLSPARSPPRLDLASPPPISSSPSSPMTDQHIAPSAPSDPGYDVRTLLFAASNEADFSSVCLFAQSRLHIALARRDHRDSESW